MSSTAVRPQKSFVPSGEPRPEELSCASPNPDRPRPLDDCEEQRGPLHAVEPFQRDQLLARIGDEVLILPRSLGLKAYIGHRIGVIRSGETCRVRRLA